MQKRDQTGIALIEIILIIMIIAVASGIIYFYWQKNINHTETQQPENQQQAVQKKFECKLTPKENYIIVNGKVDFPKGIKNPAGYKIIVAPEEYEISSSGEFCVYVPSGVFIIGASSDNEKDFSLLSVIISEKDTNTIIDSKSTAVGLLFVTPYFLNNDPIKATEIIKQIENNPKVKALTDQIENKETLSSNDIESGPISDAFKNALETVISSQSQNTESTSKNTKSKTELLIEEAQKSMRDSQRMSDIQKIRQFLQLYFNSEKQYPDTLDKLTPIFTSSIPMDPLTGSDYLYAVDSKKQKYHIGAKIERTDHPNLMTDKDFNSKTTKFINGFDGTDPIYDWINP